MLVDVKYWNVAAPDSWFQHLAVEVPAEGTSMNGWSLYLMKNIAN
ncbi:hypothetical protein ACTPDI_17185 [Clostridioides difficile]